MKLNPIDFAYYVLVEELPDRDAEKKIQPEISSRIE